VERVRLIEFVRAAATNLSCRGKQTSLSHLFFPFIATKHVRASHPTPVRSVRSVCADAEVNYARGGRGGGFHYLAQGGFMPVKAPGAPSAH